MLRNVAQAKSVTLHRFEESLTAFRVLRLDDMFAPSGAWAHEKLAFAHFDVEGSELNVLHASAVKAMTTQGEGMNSCASGLSPGSTL